MKHGITCQQCRSMFIRDVREIFSIVVSTLGAGPFLYRVWFRHGNANIQIHWANIESIIPFCPEMSNKYNSCSTCILKVCLDFKKKIFTISILHTV